MPLSAPNCSGLRPRVRTRYIGSTAEIISEETSVTRLTDPSASTFGAAARRPRTGRVPEPGAVSTAGAVSGAGVGVGTPVERLDEMYMCPPWLAARGGGRPADAPAGASAGRHRCGQPVTVYVSP